jgi:hypothetical protein
MGPVETVPGSIRFAASPGEAARTAEELGQRPGTQAPWHFLYFLPEPHGHGSLRPTLSHSEAMR